jgi:hypothetical protein
MAQIGMNGGVGIDGGYDWHFEGGGIDGTGFPSGSTVMLHLQSRFYQRPDTSFVVGRGVQDEFPVIWVHRLVPKIIRAQWSADLTGATIRLEISAPHGLSGVRITNAWVWRGACWLTNAYCEPNIRGTNSLDGAWQPDSTGWVQLTGRWSSWPDSLPPEGYGLLGSNARMWQATLNVDIEDDLGHRGRGSCVTTGIPSPQVELASCSTIFQQ